LDAKVLKEMLKVVKVLNIKPNQNEKEKFELEILIEIGLKLNVNFTLSDLQKLPNNTTETNENIQNVQLLERKIKRSTSFRLGYF